MKIPGLGNVFIGGRGGAVIGMPSLKETIGDIPPPPDPDEEDEDKRRKRRRKSSPMERTEERYKKRKRRRMDGAVVESS